MPVSGTTLAIMSAVSAAVSVVGSIAQGAAAKRQANRQAQIEEQRAARERQVAKQQAGDFEKRQSSALARVRAAIGGRGVRASSGSPLLTSADFAAEAARQKQRILEGGEIRGTRLEQQADLTRSGGRSAFQRGVFGAVGAAASGALRTGRILRG